MQPESQDIESLTTAVATALPDAPDAKTRRYDRQLRLWAATGQAALESSRILVIGASATSTSILKNLVLPGIGHFTILDHRIVTSADAGNNFFLEGPSSIGKNRAEEAVRLLLELNDGVEGTADTRDIASILADDVSRSWIKRFSLVIAHNLTTTHLDELSTLLWSDAEAPPLVIVRSAGFLAEFYIQFHEHQIIESHSETAPSLRIDKPFPALLEHALSLDFENMDPTEHGHIPYVVILVRAMADWKNKHSGEAPTTYADKQAFKKFVLSMKKKVDEENFDEAEAQAYRAWTPTTIPSDILSLLDAPEVVTATSISPPFVRLLRALHAFTQREPHVLPLTSTLPDMKADTEKYIHLQSLYKRRAEEERAEFKSFIPGEIDDELLSAFVKNAHALRVLKGKKFRAFEADKDAVSNAAVTHPKQTATHFALSGLFTLLDLQPDISPSVESLREEVGKLVGSLELDKQGLSEAVGEIARAPTADLPNTAAFLGGLVAQEAIKVITKQYVPINGYCVCDLVETSTGVIG